MWRSAGHKYESLLYDTAPRDNAGVCEGTGQGKKPRVSHLYSRVAPLHEITVYGVTNRSDFTHILQHQRRGGSPSISKREARKYASVHVFVLPWCGYPAFAEVRQAIDSAREFELQFGILKMKHKTVYGKKNASFLSSMT